MSTFAQTRAALETALRSIQIFSETSYSFAGQPAQQVNLAPPPGYYPASEHEEPLVRDLQGVLYANCYMRPFSGTPEPLPPSNGIDHQLIAHLTQANVGQDGWEGGWRIYQLGQGGTIYVQKGERSRSALPGEYVSTSAPGMAMRPGMIVNLRIVRESTQLQSGFYYAFGQELSDRLDEFNLVRFYFNIKHEGVTGLFHFITTALNQFQVPFRMKCVNAPAHFIRADGAVLYVAKRHYRFVAELLSSMPAEVARQLRTPVPLFSKKIMDGVGIAEDPGNGESFGMHRCLLVAKGIVDAWENGEQTVEARLEAVQKRFAEQGLDLNKPHINAGSADYYELPQPLELTP